VHRRIWAVQSICRKADGKGIHPDSFYTVVEDDENGRKFVMSLLAYLVCVHLYGCSSERLTMVKTLVQSGARSAGFAPLVSTPATGVLEHLYQEGLNTPVSFGHSWLWTSTPLDSRTGLRVYTNLDGEQRLASWLFSVGVSMESICTIDDLRSIALYDRDGGHADFTEECVINGGLDLETDAGLICSFPMTIRTAIETNQTGYCFPSERLASCLSKRRHLISLVLLPLLLNITGIVDICVSFD
jgi:hypothetical protein